jgi:preprotein translocase subunit Sec63
MLSKYHPDKVTHLGEEFQRIAHEKVINIKKAYDALGGKG